jgi:hypothetical protein
VVLRVEVCENALAAALIASGRVTEAEALIRGELEHQAAAILGEWARQWNVSLC